VTLDGGKVLVTVEGEVIAKRQLKYLMRRYLKKQSLSNYLRVIAPTRNSYTIKYLASTTEEGEDEEEEGVDVE
jgi:large subunit ribosomal protein L22e